MTAQLLPAAVALLEARPALADEVRHAAEGQHTAAGRILQQAYGLGPAAAEDLADAAAWQARTWRASDVD